MRSHNLRELMIYLEYFLVYYILIFFEVDLFNAIFAPSHSGASHKDENLAEI